MAIETMRELPVEKTARKTPDKKAMDETGKLVDVTLENTEIWFESQYKDQINDTMIRVELEDDIKKLEDELRPWISSGAVIEQKGDREAAKNYLEFESKLEQIIDDAVSQKQWVIGKDIEIEAKKYGWDKEAKEAQVGKRIAEDKLKIEDAVQKAVARRFNLNPENRKLLEKFAQAIVDEPERDAKTKFKKAA